MQRSRSAFTLIELSVVLVILGLLVGGILVGTDLMRAGALKSVINEYQQYETALRNFSGRYNALPGDMTNATTYWGDNATLCSDGNSDGDPGTCNGNGNETIQYATGPSATGEAFQVWNQLSLAGFISGSYSGAAGAGSANETVITGATPNAPASRFKGGAWSYYYVQIASSNTYWYYFTDILDSSNLSTYGNIMLFGATAASAPNVNPILPPAEAENVDRKLDDGMPGTGNIVGTYWNNLCSSPASGVAGNTNLTGVYNVADKSPRCALVFRNIL